MTKDYTFYAGTVRLLKELLMIGGWSSEIIDVYNAGKLVETLPDPAGDSKEQLQTNITVTLTDKQVNTIAKAFTHHAAKGVILPSVYAVQAIEVLELID